ncbi:rhomboid domain-containing protein 2 [Callorhinchus milii]|nr:rhomboid domain-containing protein 2 [Callorhinchus milii]|eukprot:gi/632957938/ref/XP_007894756.1/ PREDICTED: rhomboid domain-containing protein 2 [Callorhinchus milii]
MEAAPGPHFVRPPTPTLANLVRSSLPEVPCGTACVIILAVFTYWLTCSLGLLGTAAFTLAPATMSRYQVYRIYSYVFIHKTMSALVCNILLFWHFSRGLEKSVGTVKYWYLIFVFTLLTAILYISLGTLMVGMKNIREIQGFTILVSSIVGMIVPLSPMKTIVFITNVKTVHLPLVLLFVALFIPESYILGNICGLGVGFFYALGRRYFRFLDMSESTAASLEGHYPFTQLKEISGTTYYPALWEERNLELTDRIKPSPGSYPTQTYYCPATIPGAVNELGHWYGTQHQQRPGQGLGYSYGQCGDHQHAERCEQPQIHPHRHQHSYYGIPAGYTRQQAAEGPALHH